MEAFVQRQLEAFVKQHAPDADLSGVDAIVLDYVVEVLSALGQEDSSFDVEEFSEMMAAYVPEFAHVDSAVVCEWVFQLVSQHSHGESGERDEYSHRESDERDKYSHRESGERDKYSHRESGERHEYSHRESGERDKYSHGESGERDKHSHGESGERDKYSHGESGERHEYSHGENDEWHEHRHKESDDHSDARMILGLGCHEKPISASVPDSEVSGRPSGSQKKLQDLETGMRVNSGSVHSESDKENTCGDSEHSCDDHLDMGKADYCDPDKLGLLVEMFPEIQEGEIARVLERCRGDIDSSIQRLLDDTSNDPHGGQEHVQEQPSSKKKQSLPDSKSDDQVKDYVLSRYSFLDTHHDKITHRPCMPKHEQKKLVRYRDNHVVSTKGERFTVLTKRDQEGDEMKKTYVNLKPLRKYRFH